MKRYRIILAAITLCGCSSHVTQRNDTDEQGPSSNIKILPKKFEQDTIKTLSLSPAMTKNNWKILQLYCISHKYKIYRDSSDPENTYGIYVGWNSDRTLFRSYKVTVRDGVIQEIEARYSSDNV